MRKLISVVSVFVLSFALQAQRAEIERIQAQHDKIIALIKKCKAPQEPAKGKNKNSTEGEEVDPCTFLCTEMLVNGQEKPWPALSKYKKLVEFWYIDNPRNCKECKDQGVSALQAVTIIEVMDEMEIKREFIFNDGKLEFAFVQTKTASKTMYESYYYNAEGKLIRYAEGTNIQDAPNAYSANEPLITVEASNLQAIFIRMFN